MNKRERQKQVREQKQTAAKRKQSLLKYALWGVAGILVIALIMTLTGRMNLDVPALTEVSAADQAKGYDKARLTLVEYSDFQCPACKRQHETIRRAWKDVRRQVRFVYRHYPLSHIHPHASLAAHYTEAAGKQGKFWEMHDLLFDKQAEWSKLDNVTSQFDEYAESLRLDLQQLKADLESDAVKDKVLADIASGREAGVRGTPTLYLNGERLSNVRTPAGLLEAIQIAKDLKD